MEITEGSPDEDRPLDINLKDRDNKDWKKNKQNLRNLWGQYKNV